MDNLFARDDILWEKVFLEYKFKYRILEYNTGYSNIIQDTRIFSFAFAFGCVQYCTLHSAQYVQTAENVILRSIEKWAAVQWQVGRRGSRESWNSCNKNARLIMTTFKIIVNSFRQEHCVRGAFCLFGTHESLHHILQYLPPRAICLLATGAQVYLLGIPCTY